jgi:hypothetical protein
MADKNTVDIYAATDSEKLEKLLSIALLTPMDDPSSKDCRWGAPILFWGPPGIGKSGRIEQAGRNVDLPVETLYLSTLQPEDLSGIPMSDGAGGARRVCDLPQILNLYQAKKGILFLDELTTARPAVQGAGLAVVYDRKIAGKSLPGRVRVVGAANPPEEAAGGWNLALPMANRLLHFKLGVPTADEWVDWLLTGSQPEVIPIDVGEDHITECWNDYWSRIRGLGAGFIRTQHDALYRMPAAGHQDRGRAWASPRSWEIGLRCIAAAEALGMPEYGSDLLGAAVGIGQLAAWEEWKAYANLPDPRHVLENGWRADKRRLDQAYAVFTSAVSYALGKSDKDERKKYAIMAWNLLTAADGDGLTDIVLKPGRLLMRAGYRTKGEPDVEKASKHLIGRFGKTGNASYVEK